MTFVGKILVVLQVVLSLCFLAFAGAVFAVHTNWHAKATQLEGDLQTARSNLTNTENRLTQEVASITKERDELKLQAEGSQVQVDNLQKQMTAKQTEIDTLKSDLARQTALAQISGTEAEMRLEEAQKQRAENDRLHKEMDALITSRRQLEDKLFGEEVARKAYLKKHQALLDDYAVLQQIVRANNLNDDPKDFVGRQEPPPAAEAVVLGTKKAPRENGELVEISIGSDDGLLEGHEVFVYRNNGEGKYLGKLRIVHVTPDRAVGTVIERSRNGVIQKGDNATTKL
jgi:chaperonin cofactor prefoldin